MILSISAIKSQSELATVTDLLGNLNWRDGRETAGGQARKVKQNEQAVMTDLAGQELQKVLRSYIADNAVLNAAARPRKISNLLISKSGVGDHYGAHIDNAIMAKDQDRLRTDLSFTLFLTPKDSYKGGELVVHHAGVAQEIKGEAGELVLYPSTSIHEVRAISDGERLACIGWIESLVADSGQRELLFDLENLRASLRARQGGDPAELLTLDKTISNLMRMWAQP